VSVDPVDIHVATAGWALPPVAPPIDGSRGPSVLERYGHELSGVEVNTSFYRHHRPATWARWAASVPEPFRFAAKVPRAITHDARLQLEPSLPVLDQFLSEVGELGSHRGPLLVQLPPSLEFDPALAQAWFTELRARWSGGVACEPRHASWFSDAADELLARHEVARAGADPSRVDGGGDPGGWTGLAYLRLHGSPRMYYSSYDDAFLDDLAGRLRMLAAGPAADVWCVFDNTAAGAAIENARALRTRLLEG
jgi:uncharacterized protein YecE (DUF72 family)